ncbi:GNAT family N-acetyltransferase [Micromonospora mirobrigensis]|uniref:L-amino acid N-acyltransferase YncA n=1 Tax=Micromonospora mirobrigensis TaxID=262898 RepID=A0A1C5A5A5_9ACTN|nr:GNAT family N-acetyltransferase [Micromonospora mirobrigensis]SCF40261.1 L-amino acid N-acyltransferase YncA [Micromonospora mirobrigensis]
MFTIRREEPEDAEAVARVHVHGWQAGYAELMPAEVLRRLNPVAWASRRRDLGTADPEHPFTTLLACADEAVVGFATFGPYRNDQDRDDLDQAVGEIVGLYVEPAYWGAGPARELLAAARAGLAGRGWTEYRAWVLAGNHRGRRFAERAGLLPDGERSTYPVPLAGGLPPVELVELRYAGRLATGSSTSRAMLIQT